MELLHDLDAQLADAGVKPVTERSKTACTVPGCSGNHPPCIVEHSVDSTDRNRFCVRHDLTLCGKPGGCGLTEKTVGTFPI